MAYPDYSVVIVEITNNGVTTPTAMVFSRAEEAKQTYDAYASQGNRCLLFQKPAPTLFHRNDTQPQAGYVNQD